LAISYSATWGPPGKLITASGENFGSQKGQIFFEGGSKREEAAIYSWSNQQVVFQVPLSPPGRNFKIITATGKEFSGSYLVKSFVDFAIQEPAYRLVSNPDQGLGECHSVSYPREEISWAYPGGADVPWWRIEPEEGKYDWTLLDDLVKKATSYRKKIWIQVSTTEGAVPDWAQGKVPTAGTRCEGRAGGVCNPNLKGTPIPWNENYQTLLRKLIHKMAERYDNNPTVEAVLSMAGGCYGELSICNYRFEPDKSQWLNAGYSNERFRKAAEKIIDIYLEDSYTWPDGSKTHGFIKTPVVLQLGMGLDEKNGAREISLPLAEHTTNKYGLRVWLKQNGWSNHTCGFYKYQNDYDVAGDYQWLYKNFIGKTRVGYERGHWERIDCGCSAACYTDYRFQLGNYKRALNDISSYGCISHTDATKCTNDSECKKARNFFAKYAGAHIFLSNPQFSQNQPNSRQFNFVAKWRNAGNFPLVGQKRVGIKDEPVSYKFVFYLLDQQGKIKGRIGLEPSWPTTNWFGPDSFETKNSFTIPNSIRGGTYTFKLALEDEEREKGGTHPRFRLVETGGLTEDSESEGRYTLGTFTFSDSDVPCSPSLGDINNDNKIDINDFNIWKTVFKGQSTTVKYNTDLNCDGNTNLVDFEIWRSNSQKFISP